MASRIGIALLAISTATIVSGCSRNHELAACSGPAVAANPTRWKPTAEQQTEMDRLAKEACKS